MTTIPVRPKAVYNSENCKFAYQLRWSLAVFWKSHALPYDWLPELRLSTSHDGVRVLRHRFVGPDCSLFLASTKPHTPPSTVPWSIKGRLQHLIRIQQPRAFQRNYDLHSIGSTKLEKTEAYVRRQIEHHSEEIDRWRESFVDLQWVNPEVDLSQPRFSAHGRYSCNLHLVFARARGAGWADSSEWLRARDIIRKASLEKGHLLSRLGIVPDHLHMIIGIHPEESPREVALSYMNNIAFAQGMQPVLVRGCYIGGFGNYDMGAIRTS